MNTIFKPIALFALLALTTGIQAQIRPLEFYKKNYGLLLSNYNIALDTVADDRYSEVTSGTAWKPYYKHGKVTDFIRLYVHDTNVAVSKFSYNFLVQVKSWNSSGTLSTFNVTIPLSYDPAQYQPYREVSVYRFSGAHKFVSTILSVTDAVTGASVTFSNLKKKFAIQQSIQVERYMKSSYEETVDPDSVTASKPMPGKIMLNWGAIALKTPVFFELEWMHVDDYGAGIAQYRIDHITEQQHFDTAAAMSGWANYGGGSSSVSDGTLNFTGTVALNRLFSVTPAHTYLATIRIKSLTAGKKITLFAYDNSGPDLLDSISSTANASGSELSVTFTSPDAVFDLGITGQSGATCSIEDVTIVDITGEPASGEPYYRPLHLLNYDFRNNATRVRTENTSYLLEDVFESGYLVYRIRKVRPDSVTFLLEKTGPWSPAQESGKLEDAMYMQVGAHTGDSLNWNYQASYMEDARRKDMIGYYDGLLKPRQQVAVSQEDKTAIVGETKYDFNGRPAVQILPVPALRNDNDTLYHNQLAYYPNFNRNLGGSPYSASDFDSLMWVCPSDTAGKLATTSGAAQYYSENNPDKDAHQKFVPDAAQYPMVQTEFMPDNTGRIRRQGGAGKDHQLGSGHETRYQYSQPVQEELARVFGSEAGAFGHYKKQTVTDANGQISVSYLDMQGRVVATALSDRSPENLDALPGNRPGNLLVSDITDKNIRSSSGIQLTLERQVNRDTGSLYIDYRMQSSTFRDACLPLNLCYKCVYNYEITLYNKECNEVIFHFKDTISFLDPADTLCDNLAGISITEQASALHSLNPKVDTTVYYDSLIRVSSLGKGTYALVKKLYINPGAYDFFFNQYVQQQECGKTFDTYFATALANTDFSGCNTCDTCDTDNMGYCDAMLEQMKADVSPGGQYCQVEYVNDTIVAVDTLTSVLRQGRYNSIKGYGTASQPDLVALPNGTIDSVYKANVHTFVTHFKSSWADSLVQFHPEYCYYLYCRDYLAASYAFDFKRFSVTEYDSAATLGFLNPTNLSGTKKVYPYVSANRDPFWDNYPDHKSLFDEQLLNFKVNNDTVYSIWDMAALQAFCAQTGDGIELYPCLEAFRNPRVIDSMFFTRSQRNNFVTAFQALYSSAKAYYIQFFMDDAAGTYTGPGGFVYPPCFVGEAGCTGYTNKIRRFYYGYSDGLDHTKTDAQLGEEIATRVNSELGNDSLCHISALRWMGALADCPYLDINYFTYDSILLEMQTLCERGRLAANPPSLFPVSSVPLSDTLARFHSIDEILTHFIGDSARHINCNANLLGNVYDAGHSYTETQADASCNCIKAKQLQAPQAQVSQEVKNEYGTSCVRDSLVTTTYGTGLLAFMNALKDSAELGRYPLFNTTFTDTLYPGYAGGLETQKPYEIANSSTFRKQYPGALAARSVFQWRLNFTDDSLPDKRCNVFFNLTPKDSGQLAGTFGTFIGFTEGVGDTFYAAYRSSTIPPDTTRLKGFTNCAKVLARLCVETTTDTIYGTPFAADSTKLDSFMLLARSIRNGTADSLMSDYMVSGTCETGSSSGSCGATPGNRTKDLVDVLNEALYVGRAEPGTFDNLLDNRTGFFQGNYDGKGYYNYTMDELSPTYVEKFAIAWSRYNGYRSVAFPSANANNDCFDDANIYHDPYFKGIVHFGISVTEPLLEVINCRLSLGDPYLTNLPLSAIDSFFNYRVDPKLGMWVVDVMDLDSANPVVHTLTVMSCFDAPVCTDFAYADTGNYNRTYPGQTDPQLTYSFSCSELNRYYESQHDFTCNDSATNALLLAKKFTPFYLQNLLNEKAKAPDLSSFPTRNMLVKKGAGEFDPDGMPDAFATFMSDYFYQAEYESDSLLMLYLGGSEELSGCQLSLRLLEGDSTLSFGNLDSFYRVRPDDEMLRKFYESGDFEKGKHYFTINAYSSATGHHFKFRGWLSCVPVFDCIETGTVTEAASDNRCGCTTCPEIKAALDSFMVRYDSLAVNHPLYERMVTSFFNNALNNNLTYTEYEHFMAQCNLFVNNTYQVTGYDFVARSYNYHTVFQEIDAFIQNQNDSFGYVIPYTKQGFHENDSILVSVDFKDLPVSDRNKVARQFQTFLQTNTYTSANVTFERNPVSPCDIRITIADSSSCIDSFEYHLGHLVTNRFGLQAPGEKNYSVYTDVNTSPDLSQGLVHEYCISLAGLAQPLKLAVYEVIDSLLRYCPYTQYQTNFSRRSLRTNDASSLCMKQYDTSYISIKGTVCEPCNEIYAKILKYHDYTYKYRKEDIREAALPENIQSNLYNWYGYQAQVFELSPDDARSTQKQLAVCAPNQRGNDFLDMLRYLNRTSGIYGLTNMSSDTFLNRRASLIDTSAAAPDAYLKPGWTIFDTNSVGLTFTISQGADSCTYRFLADTNLLAIDSIFGIEAYPGDSTRFILITGSGGIVSRYTGVSSCYSLASCCNFAKPALCFRPGIETFTPDTGDCRRVLTDLARSNALQAYSEYSDSLRLAFNQSYTRTCLDSAMAKEQVGIGAEFAEYHYTLYYYDLAGNLVKTVPPAGVDTLGLSANMMAKVRDNLATGNPASYVAANHTLGTSYHYNSLGQVRYQKTPDAGESRFYYDLLGRLVLSQNSRQRAQGNVYSYTVRDAQNRITETGEITATAVNEDSLRYGFRTYYPAWLASGFRTQITRTYYDNSYSAGVNNLFAGGQHYLRSRVGTVAYFEYNTAEYTYATHYSYDVHGNVETLVQDYPELEGLNNRYKYLHYHYDLVSGKVNMVRYQPGQPDRFYHRYHYDADNRLATVYTSTDSVIWDRDAGYHYYKHGPLARMELGEHDVQGVDYAYTIHGWLKGVNSATLQNSRDMGLDGNTASNPNFARDAYGFTLGYYQGDYKPIDEDYYQTATAFLANTTGSPLAAKNLFNGNISHMVTAIQPLMADNNRPQASVYSYDQLNRITKMATYKNIDMGTNSWNSGSTGTDYLNTFGYDPNGNIKYQYRAGLSTATYPNLDSLTYKYTAGTNRLDHVNDSVASGNYQDDIDNQASGNYAYDPIGNLAKDKAEEIDTILWNVYGKIRHIKRDSLSKKPELEFKYDASGQRVLKIVKKSESENTWVKQYYVRDAQGNMMATYNTRSFIENDAMNMAAVTNWIIDNKGEDSVAALMRDNFYANTEFINAYITQLAMDGIGEDVIRNNYSMETILRWNYDFAKIVWNDMVNASTTDQQTLLEEVINYDKSSVLTGLGNCAEPDPLLSALFTNDGIMLNTISQLCDGGYYAQISALCDLFGLTSGTDCNTMALELLGYYDRNAVAVQLLQMVPMGVIMPYIIFSTNEPALIDVFSISAGNYDFTNFIVAMDMCNPGKFFTEFFVDYYTDSVRVKETVLNTVDMTTLLNYAATDDPAKFVYYSVQYNNTALNDILLQLSGFNVAKYMNLVKVRWGQEDYQDLVSNMVFTQQLKLSEHHLYGSSRLGVRNVNTTLFQREILLNGFDSLGQFMVDDVVDSVKLQIDTSNYYKTLALKNYELSNHLGNVLAVVNDRKQYNNSNAEYLNETFANYTSLFPVNTNATMSLSSGKLSVSSTDPSQIGGIMPKVAPAGRTYSVSFDLTMSGGVTAVLVDMVSDYPSGSIRQHLYTASSAGTHTYLFDAPEGVYRYKFHGVGTGTYTIDNLRMRGTETDSVYYSAEVVSANDYSAFGAPLPVRTFRPAPEPLVALIDGDNFATTGGTQGWAAEGAGTTLSNYYGNLLALTTGATYKGIKKTFTTVPGKTYRIRLGLNVASWPMLFVYDKATGNELFRNPDELLTPKDTSSFTFVATGLETEIKILEVIATNGRILLRYFNFEEVVQTNEYAFAFNGKENDEETSTQDYGFRVYNPRLGRFLSIDPLSDEYPWYTPYQFAGNKPIWAVDLDGLEELIANDYYDESTGQTTRTYHYNRQKALKEADLGQAQYNYSDGTTSMGPVDEYEVRVIKMFQKSMKEQGKKYAGSYHTRLINGKPTAPAPPDILPKIKVPTNKAPALASGTQFKKLGLSNWNASSGAIGDDLFAFSRGIINQIAKSPQIKEINIKMTQLIGKNSDDTQIESVKMAVDQAQNNLATFFRDRTTLKVSVDSDRDNRVTTDTSKQGTIITVK